MIRWLKKRKQMRQAQVKRKRMERIQNLYLYFSDTEYINVGLLRRKIIDQPEVRRVSTQTGWTNYIDITFSDGYELSKMGYSVMSNLLKEVGVKVAERLAEMYGLPNPDPKDKIE